MNAIRLAVGVVFVVASRTDMLAMAQEVGEHWTVSFRVVPTEGRVFVSDEQEEYVNRVRSDDLPRASSGADPVSDSPSPAPEYQRSAVPTIEESQGDVLDGCCDPPCDQHRSWAWLGAEYLHWRLDGNRLPPLITDGPATAPRADVAQLDDPDTVILAGDETDNDDWRSGCRVSAGMWLDCCQCWSIGGDYFNVGDDDFHYLGEPDPSRIVGRPFFNTELGQDDAEFVSVPNELDGAVGVRSNDDFKGAGLAINHSLWRCCDPCCDGNSSGLRLLSGYRHYGYDANLSITESLTVLPGTMTPLVPGTTFVVQDSFRTHNEFNGGEIGLQAYALRCWWWLDGMAKVAIGTQHRIVTVDGRTFVDVPGGGTLTAVGGLLTSEITNISRYDDSDFVFIPEFRLGAGAKVTKYFSVRAGYNLIIWGDVARAASHLPPGLQIDPRNLPPIQAGGGPEPEFPGIRGSQLVAHGLDVSIMWQW